MEIVQLNASSSLIAKVCISEEEKSKNLKNYAKLRVLVLRDNVWMVAEGK